MVVVIITSEIVAETINYQMLRSRDGLNDRAKFSTENYAFLGVDLFRIRGKTKKQQQQQKNGLNGRFRVVRENNLLLRVANQLDLGKRMTTRTDFFKAK